MGELTIEKNMNIGAIGFPKYQKGQEQRFMNARELKKTYPFHMMAVVLIIGIILFAIARSLF
jgi:hypothetical protein